MSLTGKGKHTTAEQRIDYARQMLTLQSVDTIVVNEENLNQSDEQKIECSVFYVEPNISTCMEKY